MQESRVNAFTRFDEEPAGRSESVAFSRPLPAGLPARICSTAEAGILLIVLGCALHTPAWADMLTSSAFVLLGPSPNFICNHSDQHFDGSPSTAGCVGTVPFGTYDAEAFGAAAFGKLGAKIDVDLTRDVGSSDTLAANDVQGFAKFEDNVTFSAGSTALFSFVVSGNGEGEINENGNFQVAVVPPNAVLTFRVPFTPGVPRPISFALVIDLRNRGCGPPPCRFHAVSDLSDTAALEPVQVLDSVGNLLTGVTITSESGFDYSRGATSPSTVPEPGTLMLTAFGCALLPFLRSGLGKRTL